jgi:hypothetical protein
MSTVSTVGIDLAKNVFSVHGVDAASSVDRMAEVGPGCLSSPIAARRT